MHSTYRSQARTQTVLRLQNNGHRIRYTHFLSEPKKTHIKIFFISHLIMLLKRPLLLTYNESFGITHVPSVRKLKHV